MRQILLRTFGCCALMANVSFSAPVPAKVSVGWDGHIVLGCWTLLTYELNSPANGPEAHYRLDVQAGDPDGNLVTFVGEETSLAAGQNRLSGKFQLGQPGGQIIARLYLAGTLIDERPLPPGGQEIRRETHTQAERFFITVGLPETVQQKLDASAAGKRTVIHLRSPEALPTDAAGYDGVLGLLIAGRQGPNEPQSQALNQWVLSGGQLDLSLGAPPEEFNAAPLAGWLPIKVAPKPVSTRDLIALETYAGKSVRIVQTGQRIDLPKLSFSAGKSLAGNRVDDFLVRVPHGCGAATLLALDVTQSPLSNWEGLSDLLRKWTATAESSGSPSERSQQLGSTGITELSSQIAASLEDFATISRISPWWVLLGLFLILVLIGPLDYWLVDRIWRRPLVTWLSFPLLLITCSALALWAAAKSNGDRLLVNQLDVIDVDIASGAARGRHWATLYSPTAQSYDLQFAPAWPAWKTAETQGVGILSGWCGLPESSFGGMNQSNSGAFQLGTAAYSVQPEQGRVSHLPAAQWSTAALETRSSGMLHGVVESQLKSTATGRLSGTIVHHLPEPLENWLLAYENRVYRLPAQGGGEGVVSLSPGRAWRVDDPQVAYRELRGFLTQTTARQVKRTDAVGQDIEYQQASYNPLSRELNSILPILTFHEEVGGFVYTGLTNDMLSEHDLTPMLRLGRAVLIGFLPQPGCDVELSPGETSQRRHTTLVRLILPVERSKQPLQELQKVKD